MTPLIIRKAKLKLNNNPYRHKISLILLLTILTAVNVFAGGCAGKNKNVSSETISMDANTFSPINNITIDVPAEYSETTGTLDVKYFIKDDATITVASEYVGSAYKSAEDYSMHALEQYAASYDEVKDIENYQYDVNGMDCFVRQFRVVVKGADSTFERYCYYGFIIKDQTAYIISCISELGTFFDNKSGFEYAVKSFKILYNPNTDV